MQANQLANYIGVSQQTIQHFMSMSGVKIVQDEEYIELLRTLDRELLEKTLPFARDAYEKNLPAFQSRLESQYGIHAAPMSAYTLGNWVVGALQFPDYVTNILDMHKHIPREAFIGGLPDLLRMLDNLPEGGQEWQRALCLFSIPLMRS